jgi:hypothetical protein
VNAYAPRAESCSVCGNQCAPFTYPREDVTAPRLPYLARTDAGDAVCEHCATDADRESIAQGVPIGAYLSSDGTRLTTWAGGTLARVTRETTYRGGWAGSYITAWRAVTPAGVELYGRNGGRGMYTNVHYAKPSPPRTPRPYRPTFTLERNRGNGSYTAWWSDAEGYLCHRTFYGYTKREIRSLLKSEVK